MTLVSFNNYIANRYDSMAIIGEAIANSIGLGNPELAYQSWQGKFMHMYLDFLCRWQMEDYQADDDDYENNFVTPKEAQCLSKLANSIVGTKFCVDFYLD